MRFKTICHNNKVTSYGIQRSISFTTGDTSIPINVGQEYDAVEHTPAKASWTGGYNYSVYWNYDEYNDIHFDCNYTFEDYFYTQQQMRDRKIDEVLS
jgi:hypothetical protein